MTINEYIQEQTNVPYRLDMYELLNKTSSLIVREAASRKLAQFKIWIGFSLILALLH